MPNKVDPALRDRAGRLAWEHRADYPTITAAVTAAARQESVGYESVRRCVAQAGIDARGRDGLTSEEAAEIRRLQRRTSGSARTSRC